MSRTLTYSTLALVLGTTSALAQRSLSTTDSLNNVDVSAALSQNGTGVYYQHGYNGAPGGAAPSISLSVTGSAITGSNVTSASFAATDRIAAIFQQTNGGAGNPGESGHPGQNGGASGPITTTLTSSSLRLDYLNSTAMPYIHGLFAGSLGASGGPSEHNDHAGGDGSAAAQVNLVLNGSNVTATSQNTTTQGAAVTALQQGGFGGTGQHHGKGGEGGGSAPMTVTLQDSTISAQGGQLAGVQLLQTGGSGGDGADEQESNGGTGGILQGITLTLQQSNGGAGNAISTTGNDAPAIQAIAIGGQGGKGGDDNFVGATGGDGGNGGNTAHSAQDMAIRLTGTGQLSITTQGTSSAGIDVLSQGGDGGEGGLAGYLFAGDPGQAGTGGRGDQIRIHLGAGATITTHGDTSSAILARTQGGAGATSGRDNGDASGSTTHPGGAGGNSGIVTVTLDQGVTLTTSGTGSDGITALSVSGRGGDAGSAVGGFGTATAGNGGNGGVAGGVNINSAGSITTTGASARGILAQTVSGPGGNGGRASAVLSSESGGPGSAGVVNGSTVVQSGVITTGGSYSQGILVQSIAGTGGVGGRADSSIFHDQGGKAAPGSNGGTIDLTNTGTIITAGESAQAIVAQSIGGGGGYGGDAGGILYADGGDGSNGGSGNTVTLNLSGTLRTSGTLAHGAVAQSIGGGGGAGGNAYTGSVVASSAIGGDAGNGGDGGSATINAHGLSLTTQGSGAAGLVAQSIGGGGGAGGAAYSTTVGPVLSVAGAVGGSGGGGGFGKAANVTLDNSMIQTGGSREVLDRNNRPTTVDDVDSIGVVVQSIGGGGGQGGGASALAVAIAVPLPLEGASSTEPTIAVAHAVGGSGGNGGSGSNANFAMRGGSSIGTTGAGSHGVLLQSVGGGGGNGGDSSSLAAAVGFGPIPDIGVEVPQMESLATNVSIAVGGKCSDSDCHGGHGGAATLTIGEINSPGRITTRDDAAYGALAQSIGGGGGNAGIGSANVNSIATGSDHNVTISVGRQGGDGGDGDAVTATVNQGSEITTSGAGSVGLAAQSIGGGGGTGTGSTASLEGFFNASGQVGPVNVDVSITPTITMGANGGYGGHGGTVTVTNNGTITTGGADAPAILAQSIGGGGGVGGTAGMTGTDGADGNAALASAAANLADGATITLPTISFNPTLTLGGGYGSSRGGGSVHVIQSSTAYIGTTGDYSPGIVAQSISGGGGRGGIGLASGSANSESSTAIRLGGGGGSNGGAVTVDLNGGVIQTGLPTAAGSTAGFQSFGILAQSIGAGGGTASDATIDPNSTVSRTIDGKLVQDAGVYLGAGWFTGGGSSAGDGGAVSLDTSGKATVTTQGHAAHGIVLQSVGGGGGVVGSGVSAGIGLTTAGRRLEAVLGSGWYASGGSGGGVTMALDSPVSVSTNGHGAFGLLAQSVGAGGGIYAAVPGSNVSVELGRSGSAQGNGGTVTVHLNDRLSTVETTGVGAHAVVAQSVGGGGGIVTSYGSGETPALLAATSVVGSNTGGNGGSVSVNSAATVTTHGAGAHGIIAQSIGGGGGLIGLGANSAGGGGTFLGTTGTGSGQGGTVHVSVSQGVTARGTNAVGIFAQSAGPSGGNTITVDINPGSAATTVTGGSGADGAGIVVSGGNNSNLVTVNNGGTVTAASNTAIRYLGDRLLNVQNHGKIEGSTYLNGGSVDGNPQIGGAPASAALLDAADAAPQGTLTNHGTLAARAGQVSVIGGRLVQGATGRLVPEADFVNRSAGSFQVQGDAALDGFVRPQLVSVLPDVRLPVLNVSGTTTGSLTPQDTALFSFRLEEANGQHELSVAGTHFRRPEFGLDYGRHAMAGALESMFHRGNEAYGTFFAHLDAAAESDPSLYAAHLHQLSPRAAMSVLAQPTASATAFADASMSCPVFSDGYSGSQSFLTEGNCAYFRPGLRTSQLDGDSSRGSLRTDTATWQLGGQSEVAPGLFLGGSLAYETDWMRSGDGVKGDGSSGLAAITLKYQTGPVLLTGAVFGSAGSLDLQRPVNVPGHSMLAKGSTSTYTAGVRARAAYTFGGEGFYLRPYLNLDVIHAHTDSFRENGAGELGLGYDSTSNTTGIFTPALEVGGRFVLGPQSVLRGFVSAGVSLHTDDEWRGRVRLLGASPESGTFSLGVPMDSAAARVSAGLQLFQGEQFDLRAQYDGTYGDRTHTHGGSLTFAYRF